MKLNYARCRSCRTITLAMHTLPGIAGSRCPECGSNNLLWGGDIPGNFAARNDEIIMLARTQASLRGATPVEIQRIVLALGAPND